MKKFILGAAIIFCGAAINNTSAQVRLNVNVNIGSQPDWGPVGYDRADYYYMPDIQTYYYVPTRKFIYLSGGNWIFSNNLPSAYSNYDLNNGYKVVINQPNAYHNYQTHRTQYSWYKGNRNQVIIRNSPDPKYKRNGHDNGKQNGQHNGKKRDINRKFL